MKTMVFMLGLSVTGCGITPLMSTAGPKGTGRPQVKGPLAESTGIFETRTSSTGPIAGACPQPEMSCYPGCAVVGDTMACGSALVLVAGGLAASMVYLAADEGISVPDFCGKYGALCAKARPRAEPRRFSDDTPCTFLGAGGSSIWGKGLTCKYNCKGQVLEMQLEPPENRCPGDDADKNLIEWLEIKWLEIKRIL